MSQPSAIPTSVFTPYTADCTSTWLKYISRESLKQIKEEVAQHLFAIHRLKDSLDLQRCHSLAPTDGPLHLCQNAVCPMCFVKRKEAVRRRLLPTFVDAFRHQRPGGIFSLHVPPEELGGIDGRQALKLLDRGMRQAFSAPEWKYDPASPRDQVIGFFTAIGAVNTSTLLHLVLFGETDHDVDRAMESIRFHWSGTKALSPEHNKSLFLDPCEPWWAYEFALDLLTGGPRWKPSCLDPCGIYEALALGRTPIRRFGNGHLNIGRLESAA